MPDLPGRSGEIRFQYTVFEVTCIAIYCILGNKYCKWDVPEEGQLTDRLQNVRVEAEITIATKRQRSKASARWQLNWLFPTDTNHEDPQRQPREQD
jgi:hypothetical protein